MAKYYAELDDNDTVLQVLVIDDSWDEAQAQEFLSRVSNKEWVETREDGSIRGRFAGRGYKLHKDIDKFLPPKPFNSWVRDEVNSEWKAPKDKPDSTRLYKWNEKTKRWNIDHEAEDARDKLLKG